MTEFDFSKASPELQAKYTKLKAIPGLGQHVRAITELVFLCIDEVQKQEPSDIVAEEPAKRRGRPPKARGDGNGRNEG